MERLWGLYCHRRQAWYCNQQDPAIFYVRFYSRDGLPYYHLHDPRFLDQDEKLCEEQADERVGPLDQLAIGSWQLAIGDW